MSSIAFDLSSIAFDLSSIAFIMSLAIACPYELKFYRFIINRKIPIQNAYKGGGGVKFVGKFAYVLNG